MEQHTEGDEWFEAGADDPEVIDLRQSVGLTLLEERFADDPQGLTLNTALALGILMHETEHVITVGPSYTGTLLGQDNQVFADSLLAALASDERKAAYSALLNELVAASGYDTDSMLGLFDGFTEQKNRFLSSYTALQWEQRFDQQQKLRDMASLIRTMAFGYLAQHEHDDLSIDEDLRIDYLALRMMAHDSTPIRN